MSKLSGNKAVEVLKALIDDIDDVRQKPRMSAKFKLWQRDAQDSLSKIFGRSSKQVKEFDAIRYNLAAFSNQTPDSAFDEAFHQGLKNAAITLAAAIKEIGKPPPPKPEPAKPAAPAAREPAQPKPPEAKSESMAPPVRQPAAANINGKKVFLLYAYDVGLQKEISQYLSKLGLSAVILQDQPSQKGKLPAWLESYSDVGYAIFVLDPGQGGLSAEKIFDLGAVVGRISNQRVCGLVLNNMAELPSFSGISYVPYDASGAWKFMMVKQLKNAGFDVDANLIL